MRGCVSDQEHDTPTIDPVALLFETIPEFRPRIDEDTIDLPYVVFGFLALHLVDSVLKDGFIKRVFSVLNKLCDSGDPELQNLAQVGVFETIAGDRRWKALAECHLNPSGLALFRSTYGATS